MSLILNATFVWGDILEDKYSLRGLQSFVVVVNLDSKKGKLIGITEEQLRIDIENKLRLAGIEVGLSDDVELCKLSVTLDYLGKIDLVIYSASLGVFQNMDFRNGNFYASTWGKNKVGSAPKSVVADVLRKSVIDLVDVLINDYYSANPIQPKEKGSERQHQR